MQIEMEGVTRRFGRVLALRDVTCTIPAGRKVALIGPNGSGKSTLNRILMGLLAFEGEVRIAGHSPREDRVEVARRMAYVPQVAPNLAAPVRELVDVFTGLRGGSPDAVAELCRSLELDLEAVAATPFRGLSGGMKQKLLLALALAADASLLILDEPTGSLDARTRERLLPILGERAAEATLLLCSHRLEEVRQLVDHVLLLDEGRLVHDGPAEAFLATSTRALVEVAVEAAAEPWLEERGFRRVAGERWVRVVSRSEKRDLVAALMKDLASRLHDLNVRDLEWLDVDGGEGHGAA
jgi:ABC-type multidrug transport system ATPase subunit